MLYFFIYGVKKICCKLFFCKQMKFIVTNVMSKSILNLKKNITQIYTH